MANTNTNAWTPVKRFFRMLELDKKDITYIYIYAIFAGLITLSLPLGIQAIIGLIAGGAVSSSLILLVIVVTIGTALTGLLKVMQLTVTETLQRRIFTRSAFEFSWRLPRIKLEQLERAYPPELVNRFFDTLTLQKGLPKILMDFSTSVLQIVFGLILISFYHSFFVFFGVILLVILALILYITGPSGLSTSLQESKYKYAVAHWLEELARTMTTFKLSGGSQLSSKKTNENVSNYLNARKKHFRILIFQYWNIVGFKTIVTGALLILGSLLVIDNEINIGQFVAAEIVVLLIMSSVEKLILSLETIYDVLTALEKIGAVTDLDLDQENGLYFEQVDTGKGMEIDVTDLTFQFGDADRPTLDRLSFKVAPGEKVMIAGYNRAGKSTLVQLISGLYANYHGSIAYNGIPMKNFCLPSLRRFIGDHTPQEDIFNGSIIENICLGHEDVNLQDVTWACEQVGLDRYIKGLENGYNTILLSGGRNIPRSIKTKVLLARGIVSKPRLLAMEEFFNSLEYHDRDQITKLLTSPDNAWTLIAVSDDPLLASRCDRILLLEDGKLLEQGTFEEIRNSPHYARVFKTELKKPTQPSKMGETR
jgi:ABC-type bacteriocin/lantibiotic exporter with double-glycine peptidase domain